MGAPGASPLDAREGGGLCPMLPPGRDVLQYSRSNSLAAKLFPHVDPSTRKAQQPPPHPSSSIDAPCPYVQQANSPHAAASPSPRTSHSASSGSTTDPSAPNSSSRRLDSSSGYTSGRQSDDDRMHSR